ncbi:MAG: 3-keto-5-aminohexanoate cleavage protein [Clostridia bacterium]|nr:3-keto-5-aminohexanoate cleavage protein [Clostridia bacterium]
MSNEVNKINWDLVHEMSDKFGYIVPNIRFGKENVVPWGTNFAPGIDVTPKWNINDKVMINTTVTGGFFSKKINPKQPITPEEIYTSLRETCLAGAPMVHVHVRDEQGYNGLDLDLYHKVLDPLKAEFPDVVVDGCVVAYQEGYWDRMVEVLKEGIFDTTPINTTANYASDRLFTPYPQQIIEKCALVQEYGVHPQLAIFTDGDIDNAYRYLIAPGLIEKPYTWCLVPGLPGCSPTSSPDIMIESVMHMVHRIREISDQHIMVCAGGRGSSYLVTLALIMGLDIRVGMEDTIWKYPHKDDLIDTNVECFNNFKTVANILGRDVYTAKELRKELKIKEK